MFKDVKPIIPNTLMQIYTDDKTGEERAYWIMPNEGYELHAVELDIEELDTETGKQTKTLGFTKGIITEGIKYDFEKNERELYTRQILKDRA